MTEVNQKEFIDALADAEIRERDLKSELEEMKSQIKNLTEKLETKAKVVEEPIEEVKESKSKGLVDVEVQRVEEKFVKDQNGNWTISPDAYRKFNESLKPESWMNQVKFVRKS